ncbi:hypothetical protein [Microseira sp. BLCC-F43]
MWRPALTGGNLPLGRVRVECHHSSLPFEPDLTVSHHPAIAILQALQLGL